MATSKRATIYLDSDLHRALRSKAAAMDTTISEIVNEAVRDALSEDADDLEQFEKRRREPSYDFEDVVRELKKSGKI
jgi:predicted transcriptional regulator